MNKRLAQVAEVQAGYPFRGTVPAVEEGNAFALQMRDIDPDKGISWGGVVKTAVDDRKEAQWLQPGDIVFVARGTRNYAVCIQQVPALTVCSQYFFLIRTKDPALLLPEFLTWQINRAPAQRYFSSNAEGTDQLSIRRAVLENLPVAVPDPQQQHLIVAIGDIARQQRHHLEALMRNQQQQLDALAYALLSNTSPFDTQND